MKRSASALINRCLFETLEPRLLLSATLKTSPMAGTLFVAGTQGNDSIVLSIDSGDHSKIDVVENGTTQQFNVADVHYIQIFGYDGNDYIKVDESNGKLPVGINVSGGKGNDTIIGSSLDDNIWADQGNDSVFGMGGNDRLYGMKGNDDIYTGIGSSYVEGNKGNDIITGGATGGTIDGGAGNDKIYEPNANVKIIGGKGTNHINDAIAQGITTPIEGGDLSETPSANGLPDTPDGYTPAQIKTAYSYNSLDASVTGAAQAIAIVVAYDDPTALQDIDTFSSHFGLTVPDSTTFKVVYATGTEPPTSEQALGDGYDWQIEAKLDSQWTHAIAPDAQIYLVEAASSSTADLNQAITVASNLLVDNYGGGVVNMSFGGSEDGTGDTATENIFKNASYQHITYIASSGDTGAVVEYPSSSPEVLAIGGTTLDLNPDNSISSESAWAPTTVNGKMSGGGGGGVSEEFDTPAYQLGLTVAGSKIGDSRVVPDVAYDADPDTGFDVYGTFAGFDAQGNPETINGWLTIGGTSAGSPNWSGLITLANQIRTGAGLGYLGNSTVANIYAMATDSYNTYFNDITTGSTGFPATAGFDLATGWGTPKAAALINGLAEGANASVGNVGFNWTSEYLEATSKYPGGAPDGGALAATFNGTGTAVLGLTVVNLQFTIVNQYNGLLEVIRASNLTRTSDNHVYGDGTAIVEGPQTGEFYSPLFGDPVEFAGGITFDTNGQAEIKGTWRGLTEDGTVPVAGLNEQFTGGFSSY